MFVYRDCCVRTLVDFAILDNVIADALISTSGAFRQVFQPSASHDGLSRRYCTLQCFSEYIAQNIGSNVPTGSQQSLRSKGSTSIYVGILQLYYSISTNKRCCLERLLRTCRVSPGATVLTDHRDNNQTLRNFASRCAGVHDLKT